jgi:hypothetical protein
MFDRCLVLISMHLGAAETADVPDVEYTTLLSAAVAEESTSKDVN